MLTFLSLSEPTIAPDREANVDLSTTERSQSLLKSSLSFFFWSARMWKTFSSDGITNGCFDHSLFQTIAHSLYVVISYSILTCLYEIIMHNWNCWNCLHQLNRYIPIVMKNWFKKKKKLMGSLPINRIS